MLIYQDYIAGLKCSTRKHRKALKPAFTAMQNISALQQPNTAFYFAPPVAPPCVLPSVIQIKIFYKLVLLYNIKQTHLCLQLQGCPMLQVGNHGMDGEQQAHYSNSLVHCHGKFHVFCFFSLLQFCCQKQARGQDVFSRNVRCFWTS